MDIIDLFEPKVKNQVIVLNNVYENDGIMNALKISKITKLDAKTVSYLWEEILNFFEKDQLLINREEYLTVRLKIIKQSWIYEIFETILLGETISIYSFIDKHYISESNLRKKINYLNSLLEQISVKIISRKGFISISGPEIQIRILANQFFWNTVKGIEWPFKRVNFNNVAELFRNYIFNDDNIKVNGLIFMEWCFIFALNTSRILKGNVLSKKDLPEYTNEYLMYFVNEYNTDVEKELTNKYHYSKEEINYLHLFMQTRSQYYLSKVSYEAALRGHKELNTEIFVVYQVVVKYFSELNPEFKNNINTNSIILATNMFSEISFGFSKMFYGNGLKAFFEATAPNLLPNIEKMIVSIRNDLPEIKLLKEHDYLMIRYAEAYSMSGNILDFEQKISVGVMTDSGASMSQLLINKLESIFTLIENIDFFSVTEFTEKTYDFMISTTAIFDETIEYPENRVIINYSLTERDIVQIMEMIKKIKK